MNYHYPIQAERRFCRLQSSIPECIGPIVDNTRSILAFGSWILPELKTNLQDSSITLVRKATYSVSDLVHDPEITAQALKLGIISEIINLCRSEDELVRQGCCMIIRTIAGQPLGREAILENPIAVHNVGLLVEDFQMIVRLKAAVAVTRLAKLWMGAEILADAGFVPLLLRKLVHEDGDIISIHLESLKTILDRDVKLQAIELGAVETFARLMIDPRIDISSRAEACLAKIAEHLDGKNLAFELSLLRLLVDRLNEENPAIHTKAAAAIMFITITTPARLRVVELDIIDRLVELAYYSDNQELQINCIKALTNISEATKGRDRLLRMYEQDIIDIPIKKSGLYENIERHKETLLTVMRWKP